MDKKIICSAYFAKTDTHALVQEENNCVYLYMYIRPDRPDAEIRASWVRNYIEAKDGVDMKAINAGAQPRMPRKACRHVKGAQRLKEERLCLVFLEDGDGVALKDGDALLAVIPGWASSGEFTGYARDAVGTSPFAWELGSREENDIHDVVERAEQLWQSMLEGDAWEIYRDSHIKAIDEAYGSHTEYLAIDNGAFPPKAIVVCEKEDVTRIFTLGVGVLAMPTVEMCTQNAGAMRRAELAMAVSSEVWKESRESIIAYVAGISDIPWNYTTFLADGHTVLYDVKPYDEHFTNAILLEGEAHFAQKMYEDFRGDKMNNLWVVPITKMEQAYAEENGNDALMSKVREGVDLRTFDKEDKFSIKKR
ncbi:MAG: suppressor of fused domain protein [Flavobacteriales bacterium]|nr:suppressor of fused domain protein [Flavobacteriales bacterium]